jgi:hypothetical protein
MHVGEGEKNRLMVVYRLRADSAYIEAVQLATRTTRNFGIEPTDGMFGSAEWWEKIATGELPVHTIKGRITDVYMGSMNDWPELKMLSDDGEESRWTRKLNAALTDSVYRIGIRIEIDYVLQHHRPESFDKGAQIRQVLEIRLAQLEP